VRWAVPGSNGRLLPGASGGCDLLRLSPQTRLASDETAHDCCALLRFAASGELPHDCSCFHADATATEGSEFIGESAVFMGIQHSGGNGARVSVVVQGGSR
jgi:hypothetical protein